MDKQQGNTMNDTVTVQIPIVLTTSFSKLHTARACTGGYRNLAKHLGGIEAYGRTRPINLLTILESNGLDDMLWCLRATHQDCSQVARLMAADFAELSLPIFEKYFPDDLRPRKAIEAARAHALGKIPDAGLEAARAAVLAVANADLAAVGDAARAAQKQIIMKYLK